MRSLVLGWWCQAVSEEEEVDSFTSPFSWARGVDILSAGVDAVQFSIYTHER